MTRNNVKWLKLNVSFSQISITNSHPLPFSMSTSQSIKFIFVTIQFSTNDNSGLRNFTYIHIKNREWKRKCIRELPRLREMQWNLTIVECSLVHYLLPRESWTLRGFVIRKMLKFFQYLQNSTIGSVQSSPIFKGFIKYTFIWAHFQLFQVSGLSFTSSVTDPPLGSYFTFKEKSIYWL